MLRWLFESRIQREARLEAEAEERAAEKRKRKIEARAKIKEKKARNAKLLDLACGIRK